ncbi:MAG: patatin-like phospholipase family protein [Cyanobacteria bacterium TGS_CYA1]|nr:patatin-like phospholipase family protein [Cyanobacteria bacterium TGS_CYA1]
MRIVRILSIDAGGVRAIVPAVILSQMERQAGKPIYELFDLIVGTSTGGLLALCLTKPNGANSLTPQLNASDMVRFFEEHARSIYPQNSFMDGWLRPKYDRKSMDKALEELLGDFRLKQALTNVAVTAYDTENKLPVLFKSWLAKNLDSFDFAARDVARAACSIPTYFEPVNLNRNEQFKSIVDGSVFASNPSLSAFCEAVSIFANEPCDFLMVSLGTGRCARGLPFDHIRTWGQFHWMKEIVSVYADSNTDAIDQQMHSVLPITTDGRQRYFRIQQNIHDENIGVMDNTSERNISGLKNFAQELVNDPVVNDTLDRLLYQLHILASSGSRKQVVRARKSSTFTKLQALSTATATSDVVPAVSQIPATAKTLIQTPAVAVAEDSINLNLDAEATVPPASISSGESQLPLRGLNLVYSSAIPGPEFLSKAFLIFCDENKEPVVSNLTHSLNKMKIATIYNDSSLTRDNLCWLVDRAKGLADCLIFLITPDFVRQILDTRILQWLQNLVATSKTSVYFVFDDMKDILGTDGSPSHLNRSSPVHLFYNSNFDLSEGSEPIASNIYKQELKHKA